MTIGEQLKQTRMLLGLNQTQMCGGIISEPFYSRVERGLSEINIIDLLKILNLHDVSLYDFFKDFDKEKNIKCLNLEIDQSSLTIGERLKEERKFLGLSQREMAGNVINRSFYSRVENNKNKINATDLIHLLCLHHISVVNFFQGFGDTKPEDEVYQDRVFYAFLHQDCEELKQIETESQLKNTNIKRVIDFLLADISGKRIELTSSNKKMNRIYFQIKIDDEESLWTFACTMELYQFDEASSLVKQIFAKYIDHKHYQSRLLQILAMIAVRYLKYAFLQQDQMQEVQQTIDFLNNLPLSSEITLQKMIGNYYSALTQTQLEEAGKIAKLITELGYNYLLAI